MVSLILQNWVLTYLFEPIKMIRESFEINRNQIKISIHQKSSVFI